MPRILTVPVRLTEGVPLVHLSVLVAVDAARRWASDADEPVEVKVATTSGGVAVHHDVERVLAREGLDRASLSATAFVDRVAAFEAEARTRLASAVEVLGATAEVGGLGLERPEVCRATATAFVRLYEAGVVRRDERVVPTCPRCATTLSPADVVVRPEPVDVVAITVAVDGIDDPVVVRTAEPELLPGVVAVAVPPGHPAEGGEATVPLVGVVPVVRGAETERPRFVVPAHHADDFALARRLSLGVHVVVDDDGMVTAEGPLAGFARFAARAAAVELVGAAATTDVDEEHPLRCCSACGTPVVDRLGRHWFADLDAVAGAAADAVREGAVTFAPPTARDAFLRAAAPDVLASDGWCLSHQLAVGCPLPVATCIDCGQPAVTAEAADACGRCMGPLEPDPSVFDVHFVGAIGALVAAGWPDEDDGPRVAAPSTTLVCGPDGIDRWIVPTFAISLALTGALPVAAVVVHEPVGDGDRAVDVEELSDGGSASAARLAVLVGGIDPAEAERLADSLRAPRAGAADVDELAAAVEAAFAGANLPTVVARLLSAAEEGVDPTDAPRFATLAAPVLGVG